MCIRDSSSVEANFMLKNGYLKSDDIKGKMCIRDSDIVVSHIIKGRIPEAIHKPVNQRSEEHTSELQSHYSISYAVFCLKKIQQKGHICNLLR